MTLDALAWPAERLGEAMLAVSRHGHWISHTTEAPVPPASVAAGQEEIGPWLEAAARLGLEAEPVSVPYTRLEEFVAATGPALLRLPSPGTGEDRQAAPAFLAVLTSNPRRMTVLAPDYTRVHLKPRLIQAALGQQLEAPLQEHVTCVLASAGIVGRRWQRGQRVLLRELLGPASVGSCWLLRPPASAGWRLQAREARLPRLVRLVLGAHGLEYALLIISWWLLGGGALSGRLDPGWLVAWLLLVLTLIPCRLLTIWAAGQLTIRTGTLLRRRLLTGVLQMNPQAIRHLGIGQLLGRMIEAAVVEALAAPGGITALTAVVELAFTAWVVGAGAAGWLHVAALAVLCGATLMAAWRYYRHQQQWTTERLDLTYELVEAMIGHRTRLAQDGSRHWHAHEDQALEHYLGSSRAFDRLALSLRVLVPRAWLLLSLVVLAPALVAGNRSTATLAVSVGGMVLGLTALRNLVDGLIQLVAVFVAWERIRLFSGAAPRRDPPGQPEYAVGSGAAASRGQHAADVPLLEVRDIIFRHQDRSEPILRGATLSIFRGDRILLEGPSGGGKSTLAGLLAGLHLPEAGLVLLDGLDRETCGIAGWRRCVVIAPQFHDNHVFKGTLAFNLLMGRRWPPSQADLDEAARICEALDLGPLLQRMPSGLMQMVGEGGWQLSHGEKSRLYLARALLQGAELLMLDESFAALDPQTLQNSLVSVLTNAPALLVIAHP
jgi:ATP-binding cassette subfamily B protein